MTPKYNMCLYGVHCITPKQKLCLCKLHVNFSIHTMENATETVKTFLRYCTILLASFPGSLDGNN